MDTTLPLSRLRKNLINIGIQDQEVVLATVATNDLVRQYGARADQYLDLFFDVLDDDATLVMNCFTWKSFCDNAYFDIAKTMSEVGLASEIFRRMNGVVRSPHPIYSLCAKGSRAEELMRHNGPTCWGAETPFQYLVDANAFCLTLGVEFPITITLLHSFEELKQVPYRYFKVFKGTVNFGAGVQEYRTKFYVRSDLSIPNNFQPAVRVLKERGLIRGLDLHFPTPAVSARDLRRVAFELLDQDKEVFWDA